MSLASFKARFPEFGDDDGRIQFWIDETEDELSAASFGNNYETAVDMLAAHKLALSNQRANDVNAPQGAVTSASADGLSVSLAVKPSSTSMNDRTAWLAQTSYGVEYLARRRAWLSIAMVTS